MDLSSTAELLGNFGEFIGAVAVVITLVYVAAQVKHGKAALDENTRAIEREYEIKAGEALKEISDWVAQATRPRVQDESLAKLWLDGLGAKELNEVDEYRFSSMMHEEIWQSATTHSRMLSLGRSDLARSLEQTLATHINDNPGYKRHWNLNRQDLTTWGLKDLVQAVDAAVRTESPRVDESPLSKV